MRLHHVRYQLTRLLAGLVLLALAHVQVNAQGTATCNQVKYSSFSGITAGFKHSAQEACSATASALDAATAGTGRVYTGTLNGPEPLCLLTFTQVSGPVGTDVNAGPVKQTAGCVLPCPSAGTVKSINITAGYTTSRNGSSDVLALPSLVGRIGQTMCASSGGASCVYTIGQPQASWSSSKPTATGLYRVSDDWAMTATGASCTPTADEAKTSDATSPVPACPGVSGTVNGVPVCVPSSSGTDKPAGAATNNRAGNPPGGSDGTAPVGARVPPTGANDANGGSTSSTSDGTPIGARGTGMPAAAGTSSSSSGGGLTAADLANIPTDCDKYPNSAGCQGLGDAPGGDPYNKTTQAVTVVAQAFASNTACPAPLSFAVAGQSYTVTYQGLCDRLYILKAVFLVLAGAIAALILMSTFKV